MANSDRTFVRPSSPGFAVSCRCCVTDYCMARARQNNARPDSEPLTWGSLLPGIYCVEALAS